MTVIHSVLTSPLLAPWPGEFGGTPPFDVVRIEQFVPALEAAMAEQLAEIERIAHNPATPDFDNTLAALEASGRSLERVLAVYHVYCGAMSTEALQVIEQQAEPKLAAFHDAITQNAALFARIAQVYAQRERSGLSAEQQRLTWVQYHQFARAGAQLGGADKQRLSDINQVLARLFTEFSARILKDEDQFTLLHDAADLAGLPESERNAAAAAAAERGLPGKWVIANTRSSVEAFLTHAQRRDLRERVWRTFIMRGANGGATDTGALIKQILKLRAERATLLGYTTHAHWQLAEAMARTPERARELLHAFWQPAVQRVHAEVADMQALADRDDVRIEPWDYRYYGEKLRKARYDFDANELKPYLQLEQLRAAMFWVADKLFGLHFHEVVQVPVYHADVRVWEVRNAQGRHVGLWYFDPYARRGKQSGAWMSEYRTQQQLSVTAPIVSNNTNFSKGQAGEIVLINWDDATTLFHEFGHALHGLLSNVTYPSLAGTNVARDFVEFPSQLLEHWLLAPQVLQRFARHYQSHEPMPQALLDKLQRARNFQQGFATLEYLASAIIDMELHLAGAADIEPAQFEQDKLQRLGMPKQVVMRHRTPQFSHIFSSDSYAASYYCYLWADTLVADAWEAFSANGDVFDAELARKLRDEVFTTGNQQEPEVAYRNFRGRDPDVNALLRKRGFLAA